MHVCRIRRKLREVAGHTLHVETVYGRGYLLRDGPGEAEDDELPAVAWSV
jgi:DNA-binding winged helix-turn-helix (wHTH) protein